jgi:hypothetical protein
VKETFRGNCNRNKENSEQSFRERKYNERSPDAPQRNPRLAISWDRAHRDQLALAPAAAHHRATKIILGGVPA